MMDDKLYQLFEKTLVVDENQNKQKIVQGQIKALQQSTILRESNTERASIKNVQKKLEAIEKSLMMQESARKRKGSRYHTKKCSTKMNTARNASPKDDAKELQFECLRNENERLNDRLAQLRLQMVQENELITIRNEINIIQNNKQKLIKEEENLENNFKQLDKKEIEINEQHFRIIQIQKQIDALQQTFNVSEMEIKDKRESLDALQQQINLNISQVLSLNKNELKTKVNQKLGIQFEALEQLLTQTLKERQVIQQEYLCLRQLRNVIMDQKSEKVKKN